eukprot:ctg_1316.g489
MQADGETSPSAKPVRSVRPDQSPLDDREYLTFSLSSNGLRVVLVRDAEADRAAACMSVGVGHLSDPPEYPGLAHFPRVPQPARRVRQRLHRDRGDQLRFRGVAGTSAGGTGSFCALLSASAVRRVGGDAGGDGSRLGAQDEPAQRCASRVSTAQVAGAAGASV